MGIRNRITTRTNRAVDLLITKSVTPLLEKNTIVAQQYHLSNVWGSREKNYYNIDKNGRML
jgi:hypothetical protein